MCQNPIAVTRLLGQSSWKRCSGKDEYKQLLVLQLEMQISRPAWSDEGTSNRALHELGRSRSMGTAMQHPPTSADSGRGTAKHPYVSPYAARSIGPLRLSRGTQFFASQADVTGHSTAGSTRRVNSVQSRGTLTTRSQNAKMRSSGSSVSHDLERKALARAAVQPATRLRPMQTRAWAPDVTQPFALDGLPGCSRSQKFIARSRTGSPKVPAITCGALEIGLVRASAKAAEVCCELVYCPRYSLHRVACCKCVAGICRSDV